VIAVRGGALLSEYEGDLIESMNILASQVADDIAGSSRRRLVSVSIDRPTSLAGLDPIGTMVLREYRLDYTIAVLFTVSNHDSSSPLALHRLSR
jgi:hypothetical protein